MTRRGVLIACSGHWFNAVAGYALQTCALLKQQNIEVSVAVKPGRKLEKKLQDMDLPIAEGLNFSARNPAQIIKTFFKLKQYMQENSICGVLVMTSDAAPYFALMKLLRVKFQCVRFRGDHHAPKNHRLNRWLHSKKCIDSLLFPSEKARSIFLTSMPLSVPFQTAHYFSLPISVGSPYRTVKEVRAELGLSENSLVFCLLGRNQAVKGHLLMLKAFVEGDFKEAQILFLIKDLEEFPEELEKLQSYIKSSGWENKVVIKGHVDNLAEVLSAVDCGVVPSLGSEVICRAAVEFFMYSRPVIAFPIGALPEVVVDGRNGYVSNEVSSKALADCVEKFMALSPEARLRYGQKAYEDFKTHYDGTAALPIIKELLLGKV